METNNLEFIEFDFNKPFEEQKFEVKYFFEKTLFAYLGENMPMPIEDRLYVAQNGKLPAEKTITYREGNLEILYDVWCRPKFIKIKNVTFENSNIENVSIQMTRKYIEQSVTWRLDNQIYTITKN